MFRFASNLAKQCLPAAALTLLFAGLAAPRANAWGEKGNRLVVGKAIETLPAEVRSFFDANRNYLVQHAADPLLANPKTPIDRGARYLFLERYGRFPFDTLPRNYKAALTKLGKTKIEANGLLPWQVGVYSEKLTNAMKAGKWDDVRLYAALLASYVSETHDPFNTTENYDGQLTGQLGVSNRFGSNLIDRFSSFFPVRPNDAVFIPDPTDHAFESCLSSHSWLETILLADRNAKRGLPSYTDEYFDRFYNQAAAILIRQVSEAATDVGSYWYTAWVNAGKPSLPQR